MNWVRQHWRLLLAFVFLVSIVPVVALPLAMLLAATPHRDMRETVLAAIAGGLSLLWLLDLGELPDQMLRSGALIATTVFVAATWYTRATLAHRTILAASFAVVGVGIVWLTMGGSWGELHWWVEYRLGFWARLMGGAAWSMDWAGAEEKTQLVEVFNAYVRFGSDYFVAVGVVHLMAGLAIATLMYRRLVREPAGEPPGRWRDFRFTEHLGWSAVVPLVIVLIPSLAGAKLGALNMLLVMGTLFALRGAAVATSGLQAAGGIGCLPTALVLVSAILMLPFAVAGAILLGIVDTGFDLRRRWDTPSVG